MDSEELTSIALQAANGDQDALGVVLDNVDLYVRNGVRSLMARCPLEDMRDVHQDVLLVIIDKIHTFKGKSGFISWVRRVVTNKVADYFRRKGSRARRGKAIEMRGGQ